MNGDYSEYSPPSTKADYWIPIRPATDAALWLGITKIIVDNKWYDEKCLKRFTDFPLLVRKDNLKRLRAQEVFPNYQSDLSSNGPSFKIQGFKQEQHKKLSDFVVWDLKENKPKAVTRDDVGETMEKKGIDPVLEGTFKIKLLDGKEIDVATLWTLYQVHLRDYDIDTVCEITHAPRKFVERLAEDIATVRPVAIHQGQGINHWFHATEMNPAAYLRLILTANIGMPGAGCHTWAGNYKAALFQGSPWTGPGFKGWVAEDPFEPNLAEKAHGKEVKTHGYTKDEEPAYWNHGDKALIVETPKYGRKNFTGEKRFEDYFKFEYEGKRRIYLQRLLDTCTTTAGYKLDDIMAGKYGPPGGALMLFRTYPRIPFFEQIKYSEPFHTDTGGLHGYSDIPEAIEYAENLIVHREGPEATAYLPNVIVSSNPLIRPDDYGIPLDAQHWDERTIRNVRMPSAQVKNTKNFLWEKGFQFYCLTPKTRHRVHSGWSNVDWHMLYDSNFGDPYHLDKPAPSVGEHQLHMNPQTARDLGINDGDYVYVDANPADRPYLGAKPDEFFYRVSRCMLRVKYNHPYPYNIVMMKHAPFIATERSVKAHETRPDGRALSDGTGYQSSFRYGSQQSITRGWLMPMHQLDSLFHKAKVRMGFLFGFEADNHGINTVPKETLVKVTKAEDGGMGGKGIWEPAATGFSPAAENTFMQKYLNGELAGV